jgi:phospholipid-binding lipoprotein MlaA
MKRFLLWLSLFCLAAVVLAASAAQAEEVDFLDDSFYEDAPPEDTVPDPFEDFNRLMFKFNDVTYTWVMEPVASSYSEIVPEDIRQAADNFCYNLQEPVRFVNTLLQFRFSDAGTILTRFAVNTIGGVAGLGDVAGREFGFKRVDAGLGETLQYWGVKDGFYLVAPMMGATTLRELFGTTVDGMSMTPYYFLANSWQEGALIYTGRRVNNLSLNLDYYNGLKKIPTIDPYKALRDSYFQYRDQARQRNTKPSPNDKL